MSSAVLITAFETARSSKVRRLMKDTILLKNCLFFCFLGDKYPAMDCPRRRNYGIDGCEKTHNRFVHYAKNQRSKGHYQDRGNPLTSNSESIRGLMQVDRVEILDDKDNSRIFWLFVISIPLRHGWIMTCKITTWRIRCH